MSTRVKARLRRNIGPLARKKSSAGKLTIEDMSLRMVCFMAPGIAISRKCFANGELIQQEKDNCINVQIGIASNIKVAAACQLQHQTARNSLLGPTSPPAQRQGTPHLQDSPTSQTCSCRKYGIF